MGKQPKRVRPHVISVPAGERRTEATFLGPKAVASIKAKRQSRVKKNPKA